MTEQIEDIVIVGGGPAGAYLGWLLAQNGISPIIFDHSYPREKPCGGGISVLAIEKFSFLQEIPDEKSPDNFFELVSPHGASVMTTGEKSTWSLSRQSLDRFILDKAINQGCRLITEQILDIKLINNIWHIKTTDRKYLAKLIIGADGVNSIVRKKILGPIPKTELGICYGCFAKSEKKEATRVKFLEKKQGYAWCFPRHDHLSIGVAVDFVNGKQVKELFNHFIHEHYPHIKIISYWGALIPNVRDPKFFNQPCCGDNWILIGDAAGHVDPSTGEGITYALWGAELATQALLEQNPRSFDNRWRKEYGSMLIESCKSRDLFYNPFILENTLRLASRSTTLSTILNRLICNEIQQQNLMKEVVKELPKIGYEYILSKIQQQVKM